MLNVPICHHANLSSCQFGMLMVSRSIGLKGYPYFFSESDQIFPVSELLGESALRSIGSILQTALPTSNNFRHTIG